jgi:hypothetical protein
MRRLMNNLDPEAAVGYDLAAGVAAGAASACRWRPDPGVMPGSFISCTIGDN